jgi:hypothetical protein
MTPRNQARYSAWLERNLKVNPKWVFDFIVTKFNVDNDASWKPYLAWVRQEAVTPAPAESKPAETKPTETKPVEPAPTTAKSTYRPADADRKTAEYNAATARQEAKKNEDKEE